ncbi:MAG: hypothetical protein JNK23_08220 [Opitutaceae bacterium]|nr:hypothetical protein [Opitutaceae bacterium]
MTKFQRFFLLRFRRLSLALVCALSVVGPKARACTIFVLTDSEHTLFFNNEDFSNAATRLWFVPGGAGFFGCTYVGFDDGWAQGGLNTQGLAFDWVAGPMENWQPDPALRRVRGNPAARMLETCVTVEDAVAFFQTHREPGFARARMLVADRSGASAIIGAKDGQLVVQLSRESRGFGYGGRILSERLNRKPEPTIVRGMEILRACAQAGRDATKYSNAFDLRTGEIFLAPAPMDGKTVRLDLNVELQKGGHFYDLPKLGVQLTGPLQPLLPNQTRFYLDRFSASPEREPAMAEQIRRVISEAARGEMQEENYTAEFWRQIVASQKEMRVALGRLGELGAMTLVDRPEKDGLRSYRYVLEFSNARVLQRYDVAEQGKVAGIQTEFIELSADFRPN